MEDKRLYFEVVHKRPSQQKRQSTPAAAGSRIAAHDFAVSFVTVHTDLGSPPELNIAGSVSGGALTQNLALISYLGSDVDWLRENLMEHKLIGSPRCCLQRDHGVESSIPLQQAEELLKLRLDSLVQSRSVFATSEESEEFELLLQHGLVERVDGGLSNEYLLSQHVLSRLRFTAPLDKGVPILKRGSAEPIEDQSMWLQVNALLDAGWEWQPLPNKQEQRLKLPYYNSATQAPLIFYTGVRAPAGYLVALLKSEELQQKGITHIPHGQKPEVYKKLLEGKPFQLPRNMPLELDIETDAEPAGELRNDESVEGPNILEDFNLEDALEEFLEGLHVGSAPEPLVPSTSSVDTAPAASPPLPPPVAAPPPVHDIVHVQPHSRRQHGFRWGPTDDDGVGMFLITQKYKGWQGQCPFHRGTSTAPLCRKYFSGRKGDRSSATSLLMVKAWCIAATGFDRKYKHLEFEPTEEDMLEDLESQVQDLQFPQEEVLPDNLLDEMEAGQNSSDDSSDSSSTPDSDSD